MYKIRFVNSNERSLLQDFIKNYWKNDHVFSTNSRLLDWQHFDKKNNRYNFIAAFNTDTNEFDAILGFIPTSQFDNNLKNKEIWLAIWKVKDHLQHTGLGFQIYAYLIGEIQPDSVGVFGISDIALKIYSKLKYNVGRLTQYYIANPLLNNMKIAQFNNCSNGNENIGSKFKLNDWDAKSFPETSTNVPFKSRDYIINRYLNHPVYKYKAYSLAMDNSIDAIVVTRKIEIEESSCIRIIDWVGTFPKNIKSNFVDLLKAENSEYVDMLCFSNGKHEEIQDMGFSEKNSADTIPNYFEPFLKKNIDIDFAYKSKATPYTIFKGDSDQDRPNK